MNEPKTPTLADHARLDALRAMLLRLISDGQLTDGELQLLQHTRDALDLTPSDIRTLRAEVYNTALLRAEEDGVIGAREADLLDRIVQFLNGGVWIDEHLQANGS